MSNQLFKKYCSYYNTNYFSATVCITTKSGQNVESQLKLFLVGKKKSNNNFLKNNWGLNTCTPLSASHTYTQMLFIFLKKALLLSFPESLVVSPSMLAGCREMREELKCQRSPDKNVWSFFSLSARLSIIYHFSTSPLTLSIHELFTFRAAIKFKMEG